MPTPFELSCGAWPSPLTPELAAQGAVALAFAGAADGNLYWTEGRPAERGRNVLMRRSATGKVAEVLGPLADVRSRVHEYGGRPWLALGDGLVFAHHGDQRLRWVKAGSAEETVLTPPGCRYADFGAVPGGRALVAVREDHRCPGEPANAVVRINLQPHGHSAEAVDGGQVLYADSDFVAWPRVSADGQRLAFVAWDHPAMPWDATRLVVGSLSPAGLSNVQTIAIGPTESVLEPQWAADGSLYFLSDRSGWWNLFRWCDGVVSPVTALRAELGGALWQLGQQSWVLTGDGRALLRVGQGTVDGLQLLDLVSGALSPLDLPFVAFSALGMLTADTAFAIASADDALPALILLDLPTLTHRVVCRAGAALLAADAVSRPEAISFATTPGADAAPRQAHAWFYRPHLPQHQPAAGELPPLLVMLHGGPTSHVSPAYKVGVQFWTSRGYAVVDVNYGGSTGYGRAYRERLNGQWGVVDLADAVAAVDHLAASGRVDGARVAIRGSSAGGFTVLCGLAFTQRFAAGINYYGVADLETLAIDTHKFEARYLDGLVAPLPAGHRVYQARSPVHHMGQCRAALLTLQGSDDKAVPPQQSRDIVAAARAAGCAVAYLEFAGEGHGFRQGPNIVRGLQAELAFLGRVFGYTPAEALPTIPIDNLAPAP